MSYITPKAVSMYSTLMLWNNSVTAPLMANPILEAEFTGREKVGKSIRARIRKAIPPQKHSEGRPDNVGAQEFEIDVPVLDLLETPFEITADHLTFSLQDYGSQVVGPVVTGFLDEISRMALQMTSRVPTWVGAPGTYPQNIKEVDRINEKLTLQKAPLSLASYRPRASDRASANSARSHPLMNRLAIVHPTTKTELFGIDAFHRADARGDGGLALRTANVGHVTGLDWFQDIAVPRHQPGTFQAGAPLVGAAVAAGANTMSITGGLGTETIQEGDLFTVTGVPGQYVFTETIEAAGGEIAAVKFATDAPGAGFAPGAAIEIQPAHYKNVAYLPGAFCFIVFPPAPSTVAPSDSFYEDGLGMSVTFTWDSEARSDVHLFRAYVAGTVLQPELATLLLT